MDDECDGGNLDIEVWGSKDERDGHSAAPNTTNTAGNHGSGVNEGQDELHVPSPSIAKLISFVCTFLLSLQAIFRLSDSAIGVVFKFFSLFLLKLSEITRSEDLQLLYNLFPDNLKHARRLRAINREDFEKLLVYQKCYSTYQYAWEQVIMRSPSVPLFGSQGIPRGVCELLV